MTKKVCIPEETAKYLWYMERVFFNSSLHMSREQFFIRYDLQTRESHRNTLFEAIQKARGR